VKLTRSFAAFSSDRAGKSSSDPLRELTKMRLRKLLKGLKQSAQLCKILLSDHKYFLCVAQGEYRDDQDHYIPWFTYPAIEALKNWDLSDKRVFEYGSGYSTLFWASHSREVISVEHNPEWHEKISRLVPGNARILLAPIDEAKNEYHPSAESRLEFARYAESIDGIFQVIVIDDYARSRVRYQCAQAALPHLDKNGLIILDNSDWLPATAMWLRQSGLIEVDLSGPVPGNPHHQTTSFFFTRQFDFASAGSRQPSPPVGGKTLNWEGALEQELLESRRVEAHSPDGL
jgi:hypothetical protein